MKIKVLSNGSTYTFQKPIYNITLKNVGKIDIMLNGETVTNAIIFKPGETKTLGYNGSCDIFLKTENISGEIEVLSVDHLKPIFRGKLFNTEILIDFQGCVDGAIIKNISGSNFCISINKKIDDNANECYQVRENEFLKIEQHIEKMWIVSELESTYEIYAYRKDSNSTIY